MSVYVRDTAAGKSISAYVILKGKREIATVQAHFSNGGRCLVNVFHNDSTPMQHASASGYGYDKFTSALSGLKIDGHEMSDHCGGRIKTPRIGFFPADFKAPRGYTLANWGEYDRATGEPRESYYWRNAAWVELGDDADYSLIKARAAELKAAADLVGGWSSCFRKEGLKYLAAMGYTVVQAI